MGWSFRKSKSFGPFRVSLGSRGVGMSFGVKGARISTGSRGTYVNLGANGIYYRQRLNATTYTSGRRNANAQSQDDSDNKAMNQLTDTGSQNFINELESKATRRSYFKIGLPLLIIGFLVYLSYSTQSLLIGEKYKTVFTVAQPNANIRKEPTKYSAVIQMVHNGSRWEVMDSSHGEWIKIYASRLPDTEGYIHGSLGEITQVLESRQFQSRMNVYPIWKVGAVALFIASIAICIALFRWDKKRKTLYLEYTMEDEVRALHEKFLKYFNEFADAAKIWQQLSAVEVTDTRRNSGAGQSITRQQILDIRSHQLPSPHLVTNVVVPYMKLVDKEIFFFPERVIFRKGRQLGGVFYKNVTIKRSDIRFVENEQPAPDAEVVDQTWKYLNKNGDPDRRFSDNRLLPICHYSEYAFTSTQGWEDTILTSRKGAMDDFAEFIRAIGTYQQKNAADVIAFNNR